MRTQAAYALAAAGASVLFAFATAARTGAQSIENGVGVVCDSPQQVEQFIALRTDTKGAIEQINAQSKSGVCEIVDAAFLVGAIVGEASNDKGTWQIRRILIVGLIIGRVTNPVQPYEKYTAFIISKASPI
jgi:hypothetical protein